jgi:uncharacterized protein YegL
MTERRPLEELVDVAKNPEPRCPCVLLLDTSGSMAGERIKALNAGISTLRTEISRDPLAARRVELAIVTFDSNVHVVQRFVTADRFNPPPLKPSGQTRMASGILRSLDLVETRKEQYKRHGLYYYRPWIVMITDGKPEGESEAAIAEAKRRLRQDEAAKRVALFAVGVADADIEYLSGMVVRRPLPLEGLQFQELFSWLSASMQSVSRSQPGDRVELPKIGWLRTIAKAAQRHQDTIKDVVTITRIAVKIVAGV